MDASIRSGDLKHENRIDLSDQIQSGKGIKDDHMVPLGLVKESCGLCYYDGTILKTGKWTHVVCHYIVRWILCSRVSDEVSRKPCAMVEKLNQMLYVVHVSIILYGRLAVMCRL